MVKRKRKDAAFEISQAGMNKSQSLEQEHEKDKSKGAW